MTEDKKLEKPAAPKAAFLMLIGMDPGPRNVPDVPDPRGTDGWTPGVPVALKDIGPRGITKAQAEKYVKSTGLFSLKGAGK